MARILPQRFAPARFAPPRFDRLAPATARWLAAGGGGIVIAGAPGVSAFKPAGGPGHIDISDGD